MNQQVPPNQPMPPMTPPTPPPSQGANMSFDPKDIEENKLLACLSYVNILFLIPLLAKKDSRFCQEHAKQGLLMFLAFIVGSFIFWFPVIGWLLWFAYVIINIVALVKCLMGEFWEIPVIGPYRKKINL
ncbi:hypothetical protein KJ925_00065 [Patescibacteria group bacterium]|nr:hypothetical protein [Patescibacteria group bacterium]MBU2612842.1 hypothetical protein [Patescibacteria group bacterium]